MEPEIFTKMFRNVSGTALSYSMVKINSLYDAFSEIFEQEASRVGGQLLQQKDKIRTKRKDENKIQNFKSLKTQITFSSNKF